MHLRTRWIYAMLFLAAALAYSNSFLVPFVFDDYHTIVTNLGMRDLSDIKRVATSDDAGRPLLFVTFALNFAFGGLNVAGFHAVNFLLHVATAIAVFLIIEHLFAMAGVAGREYPLFAALLFAVHPMNVEAVTYICARSDGLSTFFYYWAFWLAIRSNARFGWRGWLSLAVYIMGLMTKETVVTLPALLTVYTLQFDRPEDRRNRWPLIAAMFFMFVPYFLYRSAMTGYALEGKAAADALTPMEYLATQFIVVPFQYLPRLFIPVNQNFDADLGLRESFAAPDVIAGIALVGVALAAAFRYFRRWKIYSFSVFWFLGTLSVTSSFYPILDTYVERRVYLANPAFAAAAAFSLWLAVEYKASLKKPLMGFAAATVVLFGALTWQRNTVFSSTTSLFADTVAKTGEKSRMYISLFGNYLNAGYNQKARETIEYAVRAFPDDPNVAFTYCWWLGKNRDFARIERVLQDAKPRTAYQWGWYYDYLGVVTAEKGNREEALAYFEKALSVAPSHVDAAANRIILLVRLNRKNDALREAMIAEAKYPNEPAFHYHLGRLLLDTDRIAAEDQLRRTLELDPAHTGALQMQLALSSGKPAGQGR